MTIGVVATLKVQPDKASEFEAAFLELQNAVRANEPGTLAYQLTRSRTEPGTYRVLEVYRDTDAQEAHRNAEHFKTLGGKLAPFMAGRPEIEVLDGVD